MVSLLAGMYNSRPPQPRYQSTWDVDVVLNHFRGLKNSELSLPQLTRKLVTLLALSTLLRSAELASVGQESIKEADRFLSFSLLKVWKTQRAGPLQVFSLPKFGVLVLDPVECVVHYIERTLPHRSLVNGSHLFIGLVKPYKPVVGSTVANWIKKQLGESGIDTTTFSAHSTRGRLLRRRPGRELQYPRYYLPLVGPLSLLLLSSTKGTGRATWQLLKRFCRINLF